MKGTYAAAVEHVPSGETVKIIASSGRPQFSTSQSLATEAGSHRNKQHGITRARKVDRALSIEALWRKFFADPSRWWDNRFRKRNRKFPDFVHCDTRDVLWIDRYLNPPWVECQLDTLKDGPACSRHPTRAAYQKHSDLGYEGDLVKSVRVASNEVSSGSPVSLGRLRKLCEEERFNEALHVVDLLQKGTNYVSTDIFYCLLLGCMNKRNVIAGRQLYCLIVKEGLETNAFLGSHLIRMFALCGSLLEADEVFSNLPKCNVFAWGAVITAHSKLGQADKAIKLYHQMQVSPVKPDEYIFASVVKACASFGALTQGHLIHVQIIESGFDSDFCLCNGLTDMYIKCESLGDAHCTFDRLPMQDVVAWTALISGYAQHGHNQDALQLFQQMLEGGLDPDSVVLASILKACSNITALDQGKLIHAYVMETGVDIDVYIGSTLIDMYAKCGNLTDACRWLHDVSGQNLVTWNAMISGYSLHSDYTLVLDQLEEMKKQGLMPDKVTFACLLTACSHIGLVYKGCDLFQMMQQHHGIAATLEHYTCMSDLLGRAGHLIDAEDLLQTMPFQPDTVGWVMLLSHCRTYGNAEVARRCFDKFVSKDESASTGYVLMSNTYVNADMWEYALKIQESRMHSKAWKKPGKALVEVSEQVHDFTVGGKSNVSSGYIHAKITRLAAHWKMNGYLPNLDLVLTPFFDSGKENAP